jgi:hypothetical protein
MGINGTERSRGVRSRRRGTWRQNSETMGNTNRKEEPRCRGY